MKIPHVRPRDIFRTLFCLFRFSISEIKMKNKMLDHFYRNVKNRVSFSLSLSECVCVCARECASHFIFSFCLNYLFSLLCSVAVVHGISPAAAISRMPFIVDCLPSARKCANNTFYAISTCMPQSRPLVSHSANDQQQQTHIHAPTALNMVLCVVLYLRLGRPIQYARERCERHSDNHQCCVNRLRFCFVSF